MEPQTSMPNSILISRLASFLRTWVIIAFGYTGNDVNPGSLPLVPLQGTRMRYSRDCIRILTTESSLTKEYYLLIRRPLSTYLNHCRDLHIPRNRLYSSGNSIADCYCRRHSFLCYPRTDYQSINAPCSHVWVSFYDIDTTGICRPNCWLGTVCSEILINLRSKVGLVVVLEVEHKRIISLSLEDT